MRRLQGWALPRVLSSWHWRRLGAVGGLYGNMVIHVRQRVEGTEVEIIEAVQMRCPRRVFAVGQFSLPASLWYSSNSSGPRKIFSLRARICFTGSIPPSRSSSLSTHRVSSSLSGHQTWRRCCGGRSSTRPLSKIVSIEEGYERASVGVRCVHWDMAFCAELAP